MALLASLALSSAEAQLRGGGPVRQTGTSGWWVSGGATAASLGPVRDGPSATAWEFGGDPRWQTRATIEKAVGASTSFGVALSHSKVDFRLTPLEGATAPEPLPDEPASVAACRTVEGCGGQMELLGAHLMLRGGGSREGLYQVVEVLAGTNVFRNLVAREDGASLQIDNTMDLNGSIGYGLGYALTNTLHITFVQDFGIAWHRGDMLPEGTGRTYRTRNSRVSLRYGLGRYTGR